VGRWRRDEGAIGLGRGGDRLWMTRWTQRTKNSLSVIGLRRPLAMQTLASKLV
jgi:hypothetical protein